MLKEHDLFGITFIAYDQFGTYLKHIKLNKNKVTDIPKKTRKIDVVVLTGDNQMITENKEFSIYLGEEATAKQLEEQKDHIPEALFYLLDDWKEEERILFQRQEDQIILERPLKQDERVAKNRDRLVRMLFQIQDHANQIQVEMNAIKKIGIKQYIKK